jgi:SAM-dependent methyltransferase
MTRIFNRFLLHAITRFNDKAKRLAIHLVYWTGKHPERVHPKHLVSDESSMWYFPYVQAGDILLDLGCGTGLKSIACAERGCVTVGVDQDAGQLAIAGRESLRRGLDRALFFKADLEKPLPLRTESFDVVLFFDVLEHLNRRDQSLQEVHRLLKPEGKLVLSVPNRETAWKRRLRSAGLFYYSDADHKTEYTWDELREELNRNGFEPTGSYEVEVLDTPWVGIIDLTGGVSLPLYKWLSRWKSRYVRRHPEESTGFRVVCRKAG